MDEKMNIVSSVIINKIERKREMERKYRNILAKLEGQPESFNYDNTIIVEKKTLIGSVIGLIEDKKEKERRYKRTQKATKARKAREAYFEQLIKERNEAIEAETERVRKINLEKLYKEYEYMRKAK